MIILTIGVTIHKDLFCTGEIRFLDVLLEDGDFAEESLKNNNKTVYKILI